MHGPGLPLQNNKQTNKCHFLGSILSFTLGEGEALPLWRFSKESAATFISLTKEQLHRGLLGRFSSWPVDLYSFWRDPCGWWRRKGAPPSWARSAWLILVISGVTDITDRLLSHPILQAPFTFVYQICKINQIVSVLIMMLSEYEQSQWGRFVQRHIYKLQAWNWQYTILIKTKGGWELSIPVFPLLWLGFPLSVCSGFKEVLNSRPLFYNKGKDWQLI